MNDCPDHDMLIVLKANFESAERARISQAIEYERRLTDLNHAHDKQVEDQRTYVSSDKFLGHEKDQSTWRDGVNNELAILKGRDKGGEPMRAIVMIVVAVIASGVGGIIFALISK